MLKILPILLLLISCICSSNDDFHWRLSNGEKAPNRENQKSINGFGAWLVVTPDKDWEDKWNTPRENVPHFSEARDVKLGQELTILPFFANPKLDKNLNLEILCDIKVQKPDGTYSINERNIICAKGLLNGDPWSIFLTQTVLKYVGEEGDLFGTWTVFFEINDSVRNVTVPLQTSFNLVK